MGNDDGGVTLESLRADLARERAAAESLGRVEATVEAAIDDPAALLRFVFCFTTWNSQFGCGVAALAAKIGRCRALFRDADEPFAPAADRSIHVASYVFAAARDEFDDSATAWLDTHRCLAQAFLKGISELLVEGGELAPTDLPGLLAVPAWLEALSDRTAVGYGLGSPDDASGAFRALGYHLGSEVLADTEFSAIDKALRAKRPALVRALLRREVSVGDATHRAYLWLGTHSGLGGGVEAAHFEAALQGAHLAYRFLDPALRAGCRESMLAGFRAFAADHGTFFAGVSAG